MRAQSTLATRFPRHVRTLVAALAVAVAVPLFSLPLAAQEVTLDSTPTPTATGDITVSGGQEVAPVFLPPAQVPNIDTDGDGLSDADERRWGLDPYRFDTDYDGIGDGDELYDRYGLTNPLDPDTDHDGLRDGAEVFVYGTDPWRPDTDGDGYSDFDEVQSGRDPRVAYR